MCQIPSQIQHCSVVFDRLYLFLPCLLHSMGFNVDWMFKTHTCSESKRQGSQKKPDSDSRTRVRTECRSQQTEGGRDEYLSRLDYRDETQLVWLYSDSNTPAGNHTHTHIHTYIHTHTLEGKDMAGDVPHGQTRCLT